MRLQRCVRNGDKLKEKDKATFYSPSEICTLPAPPSTKPEERKCVVDSGASMHMLSRKNLNSAALDTVRVSRTQTTVLTASGEVQTNEEATVYVYDLDSFVILNDTPAALPLGKLCEDHVYSYEWTSGRKPHFVDSGRKPKATRKTMYRSLSQDYQPVLPVRLQVHLLHR